MSKTVFFCNPEEELIDRVSNGLVDSKSLNENQVRDLTPNSMILFNHRDFRNKGAIETILSIVSILTSSELLKNRCFRFVFADCALKADFLSTIAKHGTTKNIKFYFRNCNFPCSIEQFKNPAVECEFTGYRKEIPEFLILDIVKEEAGKKK
eukprot:TRINITY_DN2691_c0_g1_i2.p1 TRINITY_DN2691_c0_g1~~TRINITY_DN2691_c0_g1_i2.p1  ORF type:complete len:152 (-),score=41.30 TRINITY_DN2691_c0_g1_i2:67-522(-)